MEEFSMDIQDGQLDDLEDLPTSLIVANMEPGVFSNMELRGVRLDISGTFKTLNKEHCSLRPTSGWGQHTLTKCKKIQRKFEEIFRTFDADSTFQYLKSFRRVRVNFTNPQAAAEARIQCHELKFGENRLACYFAQHVDKENNNDDAHLHPPLPYKQFLISPPASPPVGWEPVEEAEPTINYDILSALANLAPGETHELHPPSEKHPGIIVHICEEDEEEVLNADSAPKIVQTSRPPLPYEL